jgi:hypothetical protein
VKHQVLQLPLRYFFSLDQLRLPLNGAFDVFRYPLLCLLEVSQRRARLLSDPVALDDARPVPLLLLGLVVFIDLLDQRLQLLHEAAALEYLGADALVDGSAWETIYFCRSGRVALKYSRPLFYSASVTYRISFILCAALERAVYSEASVPASETKVSLSLEPIMEGSARCCIGRWLLLRVRTFCCETCL